VIDERQAETVMPKPRVAAVQMNSTDSVDKNLQTADGLIAAAARKDCRLVLLPENFAFMGARNADKVAVAEAPGEGPVQEFLAQAARRYGLWVVAGSVNLHSEEAGRVYGSSLVFDEGGQLAARYDKMHLFDVSLPGKQESYRESAVLKPGSTPVVTDTPVGRLGLSICYDLRFPEMYRHLVAAGAVIFTVPAAFTKTTGQAHWEPLLRARAIENLAYVIAAGQHGTHADRRETWGHSMIVNPWGEVIAGQEDGDGIVIAEVDNELVVRTRDSFPALAHRKETGQWEAGSD
jgi:nitrilase